ncbi:N-acetylmuramoyl-L-alanine amidase [Prochlorococcus sp. MIT 1341]|uniref:N-acetylmuramoyl-L-alanine amidase n=1 Tax=Prochlorococcus sp. MIT 1341 TaxID=3096221 RepID=UPI002A74E29B|nr:N-acetylmuramoyl-L-alanine amidase [Prochlorococcus sp. MIT 1341]
MKSVVSRRLGSLLAGFLPIFFYLSSVPLRAASALAAWSIDVNGVLQLRTSRNAQLKAFFQTSDHRRGDRVWIDFPGELVRPRTIEGTGPIKEIRLGKPSYGFTRLVIEFAPGIVIDSSELQLVAVSEDRWELPLKGIPTNGLLKIGEGTLRSPNWLRKSKGNFSPLRATYSTNSILPEVKRGIYRVVIDPGHGGPDPGAVGIGRLRETDVVLDIALQVRSLLESKGVKVSMTRTKEVDLDLPPRVALANRLRASAFVSIHVNASRKNKRGVNGIETFFYSGWRGKKLAENIQEQVLNVSPGSPDRGVRQGRFFVIRRTTMPAALVEAGFVTGDLDAPRLARVDHRKKLSFAIAKGILNYLKEVY